MKGSQRCDKPPQAPQRTDDTSWPRKRSRITDLLYRLCSCHAESAVSAPPLSLPSPVWLSAHGVRAPTTRTAPQQQAQALTTFLELAPRRAEATRFAASGVSTSVDVFSWSCSAANKKTCGKGPCPGEPMSAFLGGWVTAKERGALPATLEHHAGRCP